jgi:hypothetical protein
MYLNLLFDIYPIYQSFLEIPDHQYLDIPGILDFLEFPGILVDPVILEILEILDFLEFPEILADLVIPGILVIL